MFQLLATLLSCTLCRMPVVETHILCKFRDIHSWQNCTCPCSFSAPRLIGLLAAYCEELIGDCVQQFWLSKSPSCLPTTISFCWLQFNSNTNFVLNSFKMKFRHHFAKLIFSNSSLVKVWPSLWLPLRGSLKEWIRSDLDTSILKKLRLILCN